MIHSKSLFTLAMITASFEAKKTVTVSELVLALVPWATQQQLGSIILLVVVPKEPRKVQVWTLPLTFLPSMML